MQYQQQHINNEIYSQPPLAGTMYSRQLLVWGLLRPKSKGLHAQDITTGAFLIFNRWLKTTGNWHAVTETVTAADSKVQC